MVRKPSVDRWPLIELYDVSIQDRDLNSVNSRFARRAGRHLSASNGRCSFAIKSHLDFRIFSFQF